jgi:uncharacterized protein (DUF1330 family)
MAKAYWITTYRSISKPEAVAACADRGPGPDAGGWTISGARHGRQGHGERRDQRTVIIEFDSADRAVAAYNSPGYKKALAALGKGSADRDIRIVEGIE